ncbi:phosphatidylinositol-specific phospholipase C domain-containing protein [bacterium]|nr:phosphatidylinositol-specific phospholipase C domain-containing protein [bacterium]
MAELVDLFVQGFAATLDTCIKESGVDVVGDDESDKLMSCTYAPSDELCAMIDWNERKPITGLQLFGLLERSGTIKPILVEPADRTVVAHTQTRRSQRMERLNELLLGAGKVADIAADWTIVVKLLTPVTTNTSLVLCNETFTDTSSTRACGYPLYIQVIAILVATAGTSIELLAVLLKIRLHQQEEGVTLKLKSLKLNRRLAVPRVLLDDLPAAILTLYLLVIYPHLASIAEYTLLTLSCLFAAFAMAFHLLRRMTGNRAALAIEFRKNGVSASDLKAVGFSLAELKAAGFSCGEVMHSYRNQLCVEAGYSFDEINAALAMGEHNVVLKELTTLKLASFTPSAHRNDLHRPLSSYLYATSHRTYLDGDQLHSRSDPKRYEDLLRSGCRCVHIDAWDGRDDTPIVTHGNTVCTTCKLEQVVKAIAQYAFESAPHPLFVWLNVYCSKQQQVAVAQTFERHLGTWLCRAEELEIGWLDPEGGEYDVRYPPSPEQLRHKILIHMNESNKHVDELRSICALYSCKWDAARGFETTTKEESSRCYKPNMLVFTESQALKLAETHGSRWRAYNEHHFSYVAPGESRMDSSNLLPNVFWRLGVQMVAMNWQSPDWSVIQSAELFSLDVARLWESCGTSGHRLGRARRWANWKLRIISTMQWHQPIMGLGDARGFLLKPLEEVSFADGSALASTVLASPTTTAMPGLFAQEEAAGFRA